MPDPAPATLRAVSAGLLGGFNALGLAAIPGALVRLVIRRGPVEYTKLAHVGAQDHG